MLSVHSAVLMSGSSLLFAITVAFSISGVYYYRKDGSPPGYSIQDAERSSIQDQGQSADANDKLNDHENVQPSHSNEDDTAIPYTNAEEQTHPSGPITWNLQRPQDAPAELGFDPIDTSYYGGHPYDPSQRPLPQPTFQNSASGSRYDEQHSNETQFVGGLEHLPVPTGGRPPRHNLAMEYDHGGYASGGTVDFPAGDYGR